jgi:hypothetical protein
MSKVFGEVKVEIVWNSDSEIVTTEAVAKAENDFSCPSRRR